MALRTAPRAVLHVVLRCSGPLRPLGLRLDHRRGTPLAASGRRLSVRQRGRHLGAHGQRDARQVILLSLFTTQPPHTALLLSLRGHLRQPLLATWQSAFQRDPRRQVHVHGARPLLRRRLGFPGPKRQHLMALHGLAGLAGSASGATWQTRAPRPTRPASGALLSVRAFLAGPKRQPHMKTWATRRFYTQVTKDMCPSGAPSRLRQAQQAQQALRA